MENIIKYIEKGWGDNSTFYTTSGIKGNNYVVEEIVESFKQTSAHGDGFTVYRGYKNGKLVFEMGASADITVTYY